jgi:hypothetical protein
VDRSRWRKPGGPPSHGRRRPTAMGECGS